VSVARNAAFFREKMSDLEKLLEFVRFRLEDFVFFMRFIRAYIVKMDGNVGE
jgi:hypothetical protein